MEMVKDKAHQRLIGILGIIFVVFHVVVLFLPLKHNDIFWFAYCCDVVAMLAQYPIMCLAFKNGHDVKSRFYGFPVARIGFLYLLVQLVVGTGVMIMAAWVPFWLAMLLFVLIIGFSGIGLIGADMNRDKIEHMDEQLEEKTAFMRGLYTTVSQLARYDGELGLKNQLQELAEALRYSDPVSNVSLTMVEERLEKCIHTLNRALASGEEDKAKKLCTSAFSILKERNALCKQTKGHK